MKKALIITTISGFVPQFELNNVRILKSLGYEVHYASNFERPVYDFDRNLFEREGIIIHPVMIEKSPAHVIRNVRAFLQLKKLIAKERFDLVHCHNPMGGVVGRLAGAKSHAKPVMLYTAHGFHFYKGAPLKNWIFFYPAERLLARITDHMITINREDYTRAEKFRLRPGGRVWLIPGVGLDTGRFVPRKEMQKRQKRQLGFPEDSFVILSVGELNENKNHRAVIEAVRMLNNPRIYYGICGRGPQERELRGLINRAGLEEHVRLLGYRKDIEEVLAAADCFIFPSKREGFGMAAVEAMASGVPLITSDCRGTREYMEDQRTGIVCRRNAPESYKEAIERLMEHPQQRREMEEECRKRAQRFGLAATGHIMRTIYEEAQR